MTNNDIIKLTHKYRAYEVTFSDGTTRKVHNQWEAIGHCDGDPGATYKRIEVTPAEWQQIPS